MASLGSVKRPIIVRVQTEARRQWVAAQCEERGWHYIAGLEPGQSEDISDLEQALNPIAPARAEKVDRNAPCPCGSGRKYKQCCGRPSSPIA